LVDLENRGLIIAYRSDVHRNQWGHPRKVYRISEAGIQVLSLVGVLQDMITEVMGGTDDHD
jgi:DNA-binding PadR family transcriptional regulator